MIAPPWIGKQTCPSRSSPFHSPYRRQSVVNGMATLIEFTVILYDKISSCNDGWKVYGRPSPLPNRKFTKWPQSHKSLIFSTLLRKQFHSTMQERSRAHDSTEWFSISGRWNVLYLIFWRWTRAKPANRRPWIRHQLPPMRIPLCYVVCLVCVFSSRRLLPFTLTIRPTTTYCFTNSLTYIRLS